MKTMLLSALGAMLLSSAGAQTIYYSEDFESTTGSTLPTGWVQSGTGWKSGTSATLGSAYFPLSNPGRLVAINDNKDGGAYMSERIATTSVDLSTAINPFLKADFHYWGGYIPGGASESLTLVYSVDGGTTWTDLISIAANTTVWEVKYIDLSSLIGLSNVKLGFLYSDGGLGAFGCGIDDLKIFSAPEKEIIMESVAPTPGSTGSYVLEGESVTFSGTVFNEGMSPITSFVVKYQQGSGPVQSYTYSGAAIAPFTSGSFTHSVPLSIASVGEFPVNIWVEMAGDTDATNNSDETVIVGVSEWPAKRILFEEATGTWCGWCPRGTYAMDEFANAHPNTATQVAVHNGDPMVVSAYDAFIGSMIGGYPSMVIDRTYVADPGELQEYYDQMKDNFAYAEITMGTPTVSGTSVTFPVTIKPVIDLENTKGLVIISESNLKGEGSTWAQTNYYSDSRGAGDGGDLPGWDDQPDPAPNTKFHFVARYINNPAGDASMVPATMTAGNTYDIDVTATLSDSWNEENLQYSFILLDNEGKVLNSVVSETPALDDVLSVKNSISSVNKVNVYPNPASNLLNLEIESQETLSAHISVINVTGQVIETTPIQIRTGFNTQKIDVSHLVSGVYFVTLQSDKGSIKFQFVKQ